MHISLYQKRKNKKRATLNNGGHVEYKLDPIKDKQVASTKISQIITHIV